MRVVREWVMNSARGAGHLAIHAAGIARSGRAVLFAGAKQSGKTTLTSACLMVGEGWGLLANDRILLGQSGGEWRCRGMASIVSIRPRSLALVRALGDRLAIVTGGAFARGDESPLQAPLVDGRLSLSPAQFASAIGTSLMGESALHAIAFPSIEVDSTGILSRRVAPCEAACRLASSLFAAAAPRVQSELFEVPGEIDFTNEASVRARITEIAENTVCVEIGLGRSAYEPAIVAELLRSLGG